MIPKITLRLWAYDSICCIAVQPSSHVAVVSLTTGTPLSVVGGNHPYLTAAYSLGK